MADEVVSTLVVKRESGGVSETTTAQTPPGTPDVKLKAMHPVKVILIRTGRVFLQSLAGSMTVSSMTDLMTIKTALIVASATAFVTLLQNAAELLAKLDQSYPEFRG